MRCFSLLQMTSSSEQKTYGFGLFFETFLCWWICMNLFFTLFLLLCNNLLNNSCLIFPAAHKKSILAGWQKIALFYYTKMTQVTSWQHFLRHDLFSEIWKNLPWNFLLLSLSLSTPASCLSWCCCVQNPLGAFLKPIVRFGKGFCSSAISEALTLCIVEVLSSNVVWKAVVVLVIICFRWFCISCC